MIAISHTTDPADIPWLCQQLRATYWGQWLNDEQIRKALDRSICVGAPSIDGAHGTPVGFMRVVTDGAIFRSGTPQSLAGDEEVRRIYLGTDFRLD